MSPSSTPMLEQYKSIKSRHPDSILFFRLGDFYEMFFEDAVTASEILGIALTARNKKSPSPVPFCGVPFHSADTYLSKLLASGLKVAICEQTEPQKPGKLVGRKVVKILTPGTVINPENLEAKTNNYVACLGANRCGFHLAHCDISTGDFRVCSFENGSDALSELIKLAPTEIVAASEETLPASSADELSPKPLLTVREDLFISSDPRAAVMSHFGISSLGACGLDGRNGAALACSVLVSYMRETQMSHMPAVKLPVFYSAADCVQIDAATRKNLELAEPMNSGDGPTLFKAIDRTLTPMGGRLLRRWIDYPLKDIAQIDRRLGAAGNLASDQSLAARIADELKPFRDMERIIGRISTPSARPRDVAALKDCLERAASIKRILADAQAPLLAEIQKDMGDFSSLTDQISAALSDSPPATLAEGGVIKSGCDPALDELRTLRSDGRKWISQFENRQRQETGIASLKVGYNRVFGYFVEVTKKNLSKIPAAYVRKQTLAGGERFTTAELSGWEEKIKTAEERALVLEKEIFENLRKTVASFSGGIRACARLIARLDVLAGFASVSLTHGYTRPRLTDGGEIDLKGSRHPVVEQIPDTGGFVSNDIKMDCAENRFLLITGPNMAGKSTLIRQVALTVLMAQIGSFVPCAEAVIGVADKIFTRVGASDNLAKGLSTFMSEMVETAYILRNSTPKSLVILDEIGRGTGTFDGMSLAWAIAESLHKMGARTLFATHYHELASLAASNSGVKNHNIAVKKSGDQIVFLKKLAPGPSSRSYGIQVAALAGIPPDVLAAARRILSSLEGMRSKMRELMSAEQMTLFPEITESESPAEHETPLREITKILSSADPMNLTPAEAIKTIEELKRKVETAPQFAPSNLSRK